MPIATHAQYCEMLAKAKAGEYAFAAINITSLETLNACLAGFAEAKSDGIINEDQASQIIRMEGSLERG